MGSENDTGFAGAFEARDHDAWRARVEHDLGEGRFDSLRTPLTAETTLEPLYSAGPETPFPGALRGRPFGDQGRWTIWQEYDDPRMNVVSEAIRDDLAAGVEAVWLRCGLDHGTRFTTTGDLAKALEHVDLGKVAVQLEPGEHALSLGAALLALAESRGVDPRTLAGGVGADPLGTLALTGTLTGGLGAARRDLGVLAQGFLEEAPQLRSALVSTRAYHEAGASAAEELAWAWATGVTYLRWLVAAGLSIDQAANTIRFSLGVRGELFPEIAKLRAFRIGWAKLVQAAGGEATDAWLHVRSSGATRTRVDPWVNMIRGTAETFVGAVAGADSIACTPFDVAVGPSDPMARRVARNTQLVLRGESHLARVDDPAGGSWAIESLTDQLAREAWSTFQQVEALGGMAHALQRGHVARSLDATRAARQQRIFTRREPVVGVSEFPDVDEARVLRAPVDLENEVEVELGNPFGESSPDERHEVLLALVGLLTKGASARALFHNVHEAMAVGVDLYTMTTMLFESTPSIHLEPLRPLRPAAAFEALRESVDAAARKGLPAAAFVADMGPLAEHSARLTWLSNAIGAGGIATLGAGSYRGVDAAVKAFEKQKSKTTLVILCASDAWYAEHAAAVASALKRAGATFVAMAGKAEDEEPLRHAGIQLFLHAKGDLFADLEVLHRALGIPASRALADLLRTGVA